MRRREVPDEESGYSWMDTYGDMVTLLLCFFVLLYSFSTIDSQKWQELVSAFTRTGAPAAVETLDIVAVREDPIPKIDPMVNYENREESNFWLNAEQRAIDETFDQLYQNIKDYIERNRLEGQLSVVRTEEVIILRFNEVALFDSGQAVIRPESEEILRHIINIIDENISSIKRVNIEGHTDNVPIRTAQYEDNWDLSVKRATNTLRKVLEWGIINEKMLSAVGYGEYQPIATNETPEGRQLNRRVDFVLEKAELT
ncbi:MAG TPA: flagellar motor protein MotB [Clostridiales bacterium]|nr:flagellar motor protein MotB [Clostridiales bacterium]